MEIARSCSGERPKMGAASQSEMNLSRISLLVDGLSFTVNRFGQFDPSHLCSLSVSLARSIDFAVANNNVPSQAHILPGLLKQICQKNYAPKVKAAIMVLMISVKSACKARWFSEKEAEELYSLATEIGSDFFGDMNTGQPNPLTTITTVMERFFPRMKLGQIVVSVEIKPGYEVFATDFNIPKTIQFSAQEKIRLFVVQKDNIETSACLISPPQVSFLVNGRGVNGRTNVYMDTGPQLPTNITRALKLGSNLLQAVGNFNGHYVIAVAVTGTAPSPDSSVLQDHVQPVVSTVDSDSDVIEGPSRISLSCPISYTRIKVPVKGCSCKHLQCFDFDNFIDINSRRPSWRCPHCNQYICYLDIRVDQNMSKVLREVGENVTEVIISADGSWKAILENDFADGRPLEGSLTNQSGRAQLDSTAPPNVLDLTEVDDAMDICNFETEDTKPSVSNRSHPVSSSLIIASGINRNSLNQNFDAVLEDDFWSGIATDGTLASITSSDAPLGNSMPATSFADLMQSAVLTEAVAPVLNHGMGVSGHAAFSSPSLHGQNLQVQALNSNENNQYGRMTSIPPRPIGRTAVAVQALPAQSQGSGQQYSSRISTISSAPQVGPSIPTNRDGLITISRDSERRQQFPRLHGDPHLATNLAPFQRPPTVQSRDPQVRSFSPGQSVQGSSALRPSMGHLTEFQNAHLQQALNVRMPQLRNQIPNNVRPSSAFPRCTNQVGLGYGAAYATVTPPNQRARMMVGSQQAEMIRQSAGMSLQNQTSRAAHSLQTTPDGLRTAAAGEVRNVGGMPQSVPTPAGMVEPSIEQDWQPTGRMRGSITGRAFSDAYDQFIIQPTQSAQPARPPYNSTPTPPNTTSTQAQMFNGRDTLIPRTR